MTSYDVKATLQSAQDLVEIICAGFAGVAVQITGTWVGTISFEATVDGSTWVSLQINNVATGGTATSATSNATFSGPCAGIRKVRARMSAYTSGIAVVSLKNSSDAGAGGSSGGGGGGGAVTIADGADVAEGTTTDAAITSDSNGTVIGFLRGLVKWAYERMPASLGQENMAGSLPVVIASDQSAIPVAGSFSSAAEGPTGDPVPTDAAYIGVRDGSGNLAGVAQGQATMAASLPVAIASNQSAVPVSVANGADAALGATTDATVQGDNTGSVSARLRGISVVLNDVWDVVNNRLNVFIENATLAVTQSGSWVLSAGAAIIGVVGIDQTTPGTTNGVVVNAALPSGNNNIGDVDVASVVPGTGATNLGKAQDGAHTTGDVGAFALAVRQDTPNAAVTGATARYSQISVTSTGALRIAPISEDFKALANGPQQQKYYSSTGAVTGGIIWSPAAGKRWYVTDIFIGVSAACTVTIEDDTAGAPSTVFKMEFSANSGWTHGFVTPWSSSEDAADLIVTTTAGNVYVTITGYEI